MSYLAPITLHLYLKMEFAQKKLRKIEGGKKSGTIPAAAKSNLKSATATFCASSLPCEKTKFAKLRNTESIATEECIAG